MPRRTEKHTLFSHFRKMGLDEDEAYESTEIVEVMAGTRLEAKITTMQWMIGLGFAFLSVLIAVLGFLLSRS